ncbi:MAG: DUF3298 domain-containing protein [Clostridiales bacterium]|nr:DUF3298 domain-containing protein [Clostridiales bacterium]
MKKSNYISFFILLFITLIAISTLIILIGRDKRAKKEALDASKQEPTPKVTTAPTPTTIPEPTEAPQNTAIQLYPAYALEGGEKKYGYIDTSGSFVIAPAFDYATAFSGGAAVVKLSNKNLAIDTEGKIIYSNSTSLGEFSNGAAIYGDDSSGSRLYGYIDTDGNVMIEAQFKYAANFRADNTAYVITSDGFYALIDKTGNIIERYIDSKDIDINANFADGFFIYSETIDKNDKIYFSYGVKNIKGEVIIKPEYSSIRYLGEGYFAVTQPDLELHETYYSKEALLNAEGVLITDYKFYNIGNIYNGVMSACNDTTTYFIDTEGNRMASLPEFEGIGSLKLLDKDVIEANIDDLRFYSNSKRIIFWQEDQSYELSDGIVVRTRKFRPSRLALVNYPYIEGLEDDEVEDTINMALKKIFTEPRMDLTGMEGTEIKDNFTAKLLGNLLIIERSGYDYPYGAPHGNPFRFVYHIDIRTGAFYSFKDLFIEGTDYTAKINELISFEINKNLASEEPIYYEGEAGFKTISDEPMFIISEEAITIYFSPYEIAPYAAGLPEFLIPFEDIDKYIDKSGAFWNSFN